MKTLFFKVATVIIYILYPGKTVTITVPKIRLAHSPDLWTLNLDHFPNTR